MARTQCFLSVFNGVGTSVDRSLAAVLACDSRVIAFLLLASCFARGFISTDNIIYSTVTAVLIARPYLVQGAFSTKYVAVDLAIAAAMCVLFTGHARDFIVGEHNWLDAVLSLSTGFWALDAVLSVAKTMGWRRKNAARGDVATAPGSRAPSATRPRRTYLCGWCGAAGAGKRCAGCDKVHYCGKPVRSSTGVARRTRTRRTAAVAEAATLTAAAARPRPRRERREPRRRSSVRNEWNTYPRTHRNAPGADIRTLTRQQHDDE